MTVDVRAQLTVEGGGNGHSIRAGTGGIPVEFAGGTNVIDRTLTVDDRSGGVTIFDNSTDIDSFDFLLIYPLGDVLVEFVVGAANAKSTRKLLGGWPYTLGSDDAAVAIDDALETIKLINIKAPTAETVTVRLLAIT